MGNLAIATNSNMQRVERASAAAGFSECGLDDGTQKLRICVLATPSLECLHFESALGSLEASGRCELVHIESCGNRAGQGLPRTDAQSCGGNSGDLVDSVVASVLEQAPDFVLSAETEGAFSRTVYRRLRVSGFRGKYLGLQSGVAPDWNTLSRNLDADYWFCIGPRQLDRLAPKLRSRAFAIGLPRLARLAEVKVESGGYILYVPEPTATPDIVDRLLRNLELALRIPIIASPTDNGCRHRSSLPLPASMRSKGGWTQLDYIRQAEAVITLPSLTIYDALFLRKPVAILPNASVPAFEGCPGLADSFSPEAVQVALRTALEQSDDRNAFLADTVGGVQFGHGTKFCEMLLQLAEHPDYNHASAPHLEAQRHEWIAQMNGGEGFGLSKAP